MAETLELYREIMHVSHLLRHGHGEAALKINPGHQRVLITVGQAGKIAQRDLTGALGVSPATLSELLSKMEEAGQIERERSKQDRRVIMVSLTKAGRQQLDKILKAQQLVADETLGTLDSNQRDALHELLTAILNEHSADR